MDQIAFDDVYQRVPRNGRRKSIKLETEITLDNSGFGRFLKQKILGFFPILEWLPKYSVRENLLNDFISGITCGIMAVPQGMAYASLANVDPVYGLYSSFFAPFFYLFFGTSRHIAIGVFAVASMMVGNLQQQLITGKQVLTANVSGITVTTTHYESPIPFDVTPISIISALTFTVALYQIIMAMLRLSFLTAFMSDQLVSGYTTGSAFHVLVSQFSKVIGVKLPRRKGFFMLPKMIYDACSHVGDANLISVALSGFGLFFLYITREFFSPWFAKYAKIPIPFELILVIVMTILSSSLNFHKSHSLSIVNYIPEGFPVPKVPDVRIVPYVLMDALTLSIICYMFVISMAKLFAKKHRYRIDPSQELYAIGISSLLSSFFPVYPAGGSLSRSSVCEMSGVKTQLYVIFTTVLLFVVIMWVGPLLEPLPMCILACIVIISLKGLFMQFKQLPRLWRISKYDFAIWVISCVTTFLSDPSIGLLISFGFVLLSVPLREKWPRVHRLYATEDLTTFKDNKRYRGLLPVEPGVVILKFESPLHFANCNTFKEVIAEIVDDDTFLAVVVERSDSTPPGDEDSTAIPLKDVNLGKRYIIVDCSAMSFIDTMGAETMCEARRYAKDYNTVLLFADIPESVLDIILLKDFTDFLPSNALYPSIREALKYAGIERL
uniref:STAS domain-containing protein n=1 Tax=Panagrellus redivivus TaxID=6233 RepID=A0A7E5A042_PANRE